MTSAANILAADNILVQMLPLLLLVAISVIASLAKKKQQQNADQQRPPPKREPAQPFQRAQTGPPPRPAAPAADRQTLVTAALKSMGIETPQTRKPPAKPKPPPVQRRPAPQAPELGAGIEQHVREHIQMPKTQQAARPEARGTTVRFNARAARLAMIYHEIFSPPKALRTGGDMWDR